MALENSIAGLEFVSLRGSLQPRSEAPEVFARAGSDDVQLRMTGVRGRPFKLRTVHYVSNFQGANNAFDAYVALNDGSAYPVVQHGIDFGDFYIVDVVEVSRRACYSVIGSITAGTEQVQQICEWTLIHTKVNQPVQA